MFWRPQQLSPEELARLRLQDAKAWVKTLQDEVDRQRMQRGDAPVSSCAHDSLPGAKSAACAASTTSAAAPASLSVAGVTHEMPLR